LNKKDNLRELFLQAEDFLQQFNRLDYEAIVAHEPAAVSVLQDVVKTIRNKRGGERALVGYAVEQELRVVGAAEDKVSVQERRRALLEVLSQAGLSGRLGKVYCTEVDLRTAAFRDVPHKVGLPPFDMVVAADYSPQSGYHGIFVAGQEVMSWLLPTPYDLAWQLRERHRFSTLEQMAELVGLLGAGFPVA
jgi:hypothetical protein